MNVPVEIEYVTLENENGFSVDSVCATCSRCGEETESFGTGEASIRRCLVLLREECPRNERNFYYDQDEESSVQSGPAPWLGG